MVCYNLKSLKFIRRFRDYFPRYLDSKQKKHTSKKVSYEYTEKKNMVVTTKSHCKSVIISGTIFYLWDRYNIVESAIINIIIIFK